MDNYNPRQNTRMRWKDARELEKYVFISGKFNFTDETLEHVLEDELYGKIATEILECSKKGNRKGVIIEDTEGGGCYVGEILDDGTATLIQTNIASANSVDLQLDTSDENNVKLIVTTAYEQILTGDNVKTLFGNQSLIGTGNIDLYVHHLLINSNCFFTIYSSNNLKVDTPEKLTTLLKDKNTSIYYFGYQQTQYINIAAISFNAATNLWQIRVSGEETSSKITDVTDIVTTI